MMLSDLEPMASSPVPRAEFARHLRLGYGFADDGSEDGLLDDYTRAAVAAVEAQTGQILVRRGLRLTVGVWGRDGRLVLPVGPVVSLDALRWRRGAETVAVDLAGIEVSPDTTRPVLCAVGGGALPPVPDGWRAEIEFTAGHGEDWDGVPPDLGHAVLMLAAHFHAERSMAGLPIGVAALLQPHRAVRL